MGARRIAAALAAAVLMSLSAAVPAGAQEPEFQTVKGKTEPVYTESVLEEHYVETEYGRIYGWVRRPVVPEGTKVPIILTYSPYHVIESATAGGEGIPPGPESGTVGYYVPRGYARAWFHLVGTGISEGCYDHGGKAERETGKAVIDFLGAQPWSNGKVGMIGGSYDGTTQWAAAIEQPKHLATIIPQVAISRWYDYAHLQGVRIASGGLTPVAFDYGFNHGTYDPTNPQAIIDSANPDCEQVDHNEKAFLPDPVYDEYWDERDYLAQAHKIQVPMLIQSSWTESNVYAHNSMNMWDKMQGRVPLKLHMGLAGHSANQVEDHNDIEHAWFDRYLYGLDTGVERLPIVDTVDRGTRERRQEPSFPPPNTRRIALALGTGPAPGTLGLGDEDNVWRDIDPQQEEGDLLAGGKTGEEAIVFLGEPLKENTRIAGRPRFEATVITDATETFLTPILFEETADGDRRVIAEGALNSRNRDGERVSTPVDPGQPWNGAVDFLPVDYVLPAGSRIGLAVGSMSTGIAFNSDTTFATNELVLGDSRLVLPTQFGRTALGGTDIDPPVISAPAAQPPVFAPPPAKKSDVRVSFKRKGKRLVVVVKSASKLPKLRLTVLDGRKKVLARGAVKPGARKRTVVLRLKKTPARGKLTVEARGDGIVARARR